MSENYDGFEKRLIRLRFQKVNIGEGENIREVLERKFLNQKELCFYYRNGDDIYTAGNISFDEENTNEHRKHNDPYPRFLLVKEHYGNLKFRNISKLCDFTIPITVYGDVKFIDDIGIKRNGSAFKRKNDFFSFNTIYGSLLFKKSKYVVNLSVVGKHLDSDILIEGYKKLKVLELKHVKFLGEDVFVQDYRKDDDNFEIVFNFDMEYSGDVAYKNDVLTIEEYKELILEKQKNKRKQLALV